MLEAMNGAEFQVDEQGTVQVLQEAPGASLLLDPHRRTWLPWGRRPQESGDWPAGGEAAWSAIYRPTWQRWAPERVLLRPLRWRASNGRWSDLRPGFAVLAGVIPTFLSPGAIELDGYSRADAGSQR